MRWRARFRTGSLKRVGLREDGGGARAVVRDEGVLDVGREGLVTSEEPLNLLLLRLNMFEGVGRLLDGVGREREGGAVGWNLSSSLVTGSVS